MKLESNLNSLNRNTDKLISDLAPEANQKEAAKAPENLASELKLSPNAQKMQQLASALANSVPNNAVKVAKLKEQILAGQHPIQSSDKAIQAEAFGKLADKMVTEYSS